MLEPPVVGLFARRIDGGIHRVEHSADEDRPVHRRRARAFEHAGQIVERKAGPGRREVEEKFDASGHRIRPPLSLSPNFGPAAGAYSTCPCRGAARLEESRGGKACVSTW